MSDPILAPVPTAPSSSLRPPDDPARPSSAASNRSNTSNRSNSSRGRSSNASRNSSRSSKADPDKKRQSGQTTTISGGVQLGASEPVARAKGGSSPNPNGKASANANAKKKDGAAGKATGNGERRASQQQKRPEPIKTASSDTKAASSAKPSSTDQKSKQGESQSAPAPKSMHTVPSVPKTALEAAQEIAQQKRKDSASASGGDALSNLQKMIKDLKSLPAGSSSSGSASGSRSASGAREPPSAKAPAPSESNSLAVPASASTSASSAPKKLKADAPSFTPSFQAVSPVASQAPISPVGVVSPLWQPAQPRSASHGSAGNRRPSSSTLNNGSLPAYSAPNLGQQLPLPMYANSLPQFAGYPNQLHVHPETENEDLSPLQFSPHPDGSYQHQQLLAAQQLQYQQIQLLQAQLAASQMQQVQQHHQQHQSTSFIAPRFQALAAQRAAQQQQLQAQQLAQAQQVFEIQQQQLIEYQRRQDESAAANAAAIAEATLKNPPPVFEEDSPEPRHASLSSNGRPQLAPSFTFGAKRAPADSADGNDRSSMSPPGQPIINRSEGIGGAAAAGLAGLAARAHKRTGSELTPAMQQQLDLQSQIEALQAKQRELMEDEVAKSGGTPLSQIAQKVTPSQSIARHRRVQSSLPSASPNETFGGLLADLGRPEPPKSEMPPPPIPTGNGHNRRHSVNVFNKPAGQGSGFGSMSGDIPENGVPTTNGGGGGHHRSGSRSGFESGNWRSSSISQSQSQNNGPPQVADLAAAQAQLQSLAQFRAAAGGGHSKMASFSFPNMLPNLLAATTLSTPMGQSLWQQQQAFQLQLQQSSSGVQRKSLFAPYLPQASLPPLLSAGKLVVGILRVNKKNRSDAYVATDVLEADIYICGSKDRNRALEGDIVAVELLDVDEVWNTKKDKEEKKRKKEENAAYDLKPATAKKLEKKKDDVEVEGQGLTLFDDEEVNDDTKPTYAGHVVAVVERMPGQLFSGQLGVLRPSSAATKEKQEIERREREGDRGRAEPAPSTERPKIVWFKPTDKRVPLIAIPTEQAPADFIENPDAHADKLFVATIKRWPITSLHPFGTLVEELGPIGNCEVETSALLKDCNFPTEEFTDVALKCLPPLPWTIPEREFEVRKDLREERIFTIDPPTAKDLDDALSIKTNDDGSFSVGVHIADVSYFVKTNTALDRDARKRATSVYLVQRAVPMLPPQLSEQLCSLQPGEERLAFSAFFTIDKDGNVLSTDFARTIIKSCAKLSYGDAGTVVDGGSLPDSKVAGHSPADVAADIKALSDLASKIKAKRIENGAMKATKLKIAFKLDERGQPVDCEPYTRTEAHSLVEEFMLLANMAVARQIAYGLPEQALLRRHEAPIERRIDGFVKRAKKLGYEFDGSSAKSLQQGFDNVKDADAALCLELLKRKAMQRARYFCTGMLDIAKYSHWALQAPLYTHFTSPIRRYADVLVHRMLDACLTSPSPTDVKFLMDRDQVAKCAQQCNMKKQSAKLAEDQSTHLFLCMLIHDLTEKYGPVVREGRVTGVLDAAFDVVVPEFGIEKRVHVDKMPLDNVQYDEHKDILSLYWTNKDVLTFLAETTDEAHVKAVHAARNSKSSASQSADVSGLTAQYAKSANGSKPQYDGLRSNGGHKIQDVRELMKVPVIVMSDMTKSPPVLVVYASNPYAS